MKNVGFSLTRVAGTLPFDFPILQKLASGEDYLFLDRLADEWHSGKTCFDREGELLMTAVFNGACVGIGGLTSDPATIGAFRFRRFYVHPKFRRQGIGFLIVREILSQPMAGNPEIWVHPGSESARHFWIRVGYRALPNQELLVARKEDLSRQD